MRYELHANHWKLEKFVERITVAQWRQILLRHEDTLTFEGHIRQLRAKNLGYGVVEIGKAPLDTERKDK